jgi:hypothetical protein
VIALLGKALLIGIILTVVFALASAIRFNLADDSYGEDR